MPRKALSKEKVRKAIPGSGGIISHICKVTGYSWAAVKELIDNDAVLLAAFRDEESAVDDMAEAKVIKAISEGDMQTARWWLARRRKGRYGDNLDITTGGQPLKGYVIVSPDDWQEN